jgi:hypothetical protein
VRDHYLRFVGKARPDLLPRYQRAYQGTYAPQEYLQRLNERVDRLRERYGFGEDMMRQRRLVPSPTGYASTLTVPRDRQLALPLS